MKNSIYVAAVIASFTLLINEMPKLRLGVAVSYTRAWAVSVSATIGIGIEPLRMPSI